MRLGYKLFRRKNGKLYPLYVFANEEVPLRSLLFAKEGIKGKDDKHVKSKLGDLAYRPGWHITTVPLADHIGIRQKNGKLYQAPDTVWCLVRYSDTVDYQQKAFARGTNKHGKLIEREAFLDYIPRNGFYFYTTNPNASTPWVIAGEMEVIRELSHEEVITICEAHGYKAQPLAI